MTISFQSGQYFSTVQPGTTGLGPLGLGATGSGMGGTVASFSCWIRLDAVPDVNTSNNTSLISVGGWPWQLSLAQNSNSRLTFDWRNTTNTGTPNGDLNGCIPNFSFHIASTWINGTQKFYSNGFLFRTTTAPGPLTDPNVQPLTLGNEAYSSLNTPFSIDDVVYWQNYTLTLSDILNIRNRTISPFTISSSNIVWGITCTGVTGQVAQMTDPGLTYVGYANATDYDTYTGAGWSTSSGSPVYAPKLTFSPYTLYQAAEIGGSGQTVCFAFNDVTGIEAPVTSVTTNPTISINSGSPISLTNPIWSVSQGAGGLPILPYIIYPLNSTTIAPTDVVTVTAPEGWCSTLSGNPIAVNNLVLLNNSGGTTLPAFIDKSKQMEVGMNCFSPAYYTTIPIQNNIAKFSSRWLPDNSFTLGANGYPSSFNPGTTQLSAIVWRDDVNPGYDGAIAGIYTLRWDGSSLAALQPSAGSTTVTKLSQRLTGTTDNIITYNVTVSGTPVYSGLQVTIFGTNISNIQVYPPNQIPDTNLQLLHNDFLRLLYGASCVRAMDLLGTNGSNISVYSDFHTNADYSYYQPTSTLSVNVSTMQDYTNNGFYNTSSFYILITTATPHGFLSGMAITFNNVAPLNQSSSTFNINGFSSFLCQVISPTEFTVAVVASGGPIIGVQSPGGQATVPIGITSVPIADVVTIANSIHADLWINVPHLMTNAGITSMANYVAANLTTGKKCYVEYSNECWNYSGSFTQTRFCYGMGNTDPDIISREPNVFYRGYRYYADRAGNAHNLFYTSFNTAGRGTDLVRVYGGQFSTNTYTNVVLNEAAFQGNQVDAVCIAPYYDNGPSEPSYGAVYDSLSIEQLMDLSEYFMTYGTIVLFTKEAMDNLPVGVKLVMYEGGPQSGIPLYNGQSISANNLNIAARSVSWGRNTRQALLYNYLMQQYNNIGASLYNAFSLGGTCGTVDPGNPDSANWPIYFRWNMVASPGDGSDGRFVNSTDYTDVSQVNSTIGYGVTRWQQFQHGRFALLNIKTGGLFFPITIGY